MEAQSRGHPRELVGTAPTVDLLLATDSEIWRRICRNYGERFRYRWNVCKKTMSISRKANSWVTV